MAFLKGLLERFRDSRLEAAAPAMHGAVAREPDPLPQDSAEQWRTRGNDALGQWKLVEAAECYRRAVAADPSDPLAWLNRGFVAVEQGDAAQAVGFLQQALSLGRNGGAFLADVHFLLGRAYRMQSRSNDALAAFDAAVAANPRFAEAMRERVYVLLEQLRNRDALACARRLCEVDSSAESRLALVRALFELRQHEEALTVLQGLVRDEPGSADVWSAMGNVLRELGRVDEALEACRKSIAIAGPTPALLVHEAVSLFAAGQQDEAVSKLLALWEAQPADRYVSAMLMNVLMESLRIAEAIRVGRSALDHHSDPEVHWLLSLAHLTLGEFEPGWREYEWRWRAPSGTRPVLSGLDRPWWSGQESLSGKTILVAPEQGLGDCIQFLRYVPLVAARAKSVALVLPQQLYSLAASMTWPENCVVAPPEGGPVASLEFQTSLMSLPLALGVPEPLAMSAPYLRGDPGRVQAWAERLAALGEGKLNVGITWSGNPEHKNDRNRSIPLREFRALEAAGCRFISLQPTVRPRDREALEAWSALLRWGEDLQSFLDTASLMEALDLVVAVDTSVVHLAGALGKSTWALIPHVPDWRWMLGREDTPWYPSVRLCRQKGRGDWSGVLSEIRQELEQLAKRR